MLKRLQCLSGNSLKIIAAISMIFDHIGLIFFPDLLIFRIIGRLSFPIFAYMISEGARYTKNKLRYFLLMFSFAVICQSVFALVSGGMLYMCIFVTFSLSIILIYVLRWTKETVFSSRERDLVKYLAFFIFLLSLSAVWLFTQLVTVDYGFYGVIIPVLISLFDFEGIDAPFELRRLDSFYTKITALSFGLLALSFDVGGAQYYCLLSILPLLLYSGKRGRYKMKYFFYLFYPIHIALLQVIYILIK